MGFYSQVILPRLLNRAMSDKSFAAKRASLLAQAGGEVLELGFGSGLNFQYYPARIDKLVALDVSSGMQKLARQKANLAAFPIEFVTQSGEQLPFDNAAFDTVVSTWTLCSIERVEEALAEIRRVLKPGGHFIFIEHGLAPDTRVQIWQRRLTPLQKKLVGNCHFDRPIRQLIEGQGFKFKALKEYYWENAPKTVGYTYQGVAYTD